jgi:hypothetical protein
MKLKFKKRLSETPKYALDSPGGVRCPEIWELESGDIAVIGKDITSRVKNTLPSEVVLGKEERIILIPRKVLESVKRNI